MIAEGAVCLTCHWNSHVEREEPDGAAEQTGNPSREGVVLSVTPKKTPLTVPHGITKHSLGIKAKILSIPHRRPPKDVC